DPLAAVIDDVVDPLVLDGAALLGLGLALADLAADHATDVERAHRKLRARLADRLRGDDADRHALLDQRPRGQVPSVAQPAHAQRGLAGHRAPDEDLVHAQRLDPAGLIDGDHLVFLDDHLLGDRVLDRVTADAAADDLAQRPIDLVALVQRRL